MANNRITVDEKKPNINTKATSCQTINGKQFKQFIEAALRWLRSN